MAALALALSGAVPAFAQDSPSQAPDIRVDGQGWGVPAQELRLALYAVAGVLLPHVAGAPAAPIVVSHTSGPPVTLYQRGPRGEYQVHLHATGSSLPLTVYEFAHELTHIVSNYDHGAGEERQRRNQWFEESVCETASLFVLDRLAAAWERPGQPFAPRAPELRRFFDALVNEPHRRLPGGYGFAAWLADNEPGLRSDPYRRKQDDLVARRLLPLFEAHPAGWGALRFLNLDPRDDEATLGEYLAHWYRNSPSADRGFVAAVAEALATGIAARANATAQLDGTLPAVATR